MSTRDRDPMVLYVDDDKSNRIVVEQAFQRSFRLETCASGEEALALLERAEVAVLLTDQRMPGISGNELLRLCRERSPETVGIVVTAYEDFEPVLEAVNQQLAARYIIKPWNAREVEATIAWAIEVYRLSREKAELELRLLARERRTTLESAAQALALLGHEQTDALLRRLVAARQGDDGPGDAGLAARHAVTLCRAEVTARGGALRHRLGAELPPLAMSTSALTEVIVNLMLNAAEAFPSERRPWLVELRVEREEGGVRLVVQDNGSGMSPTSLARAREPFFSTRGEGRNGLGLFHVQCLVSAAGGRVLLDSVEGEGTTAMAWIPSL